MKYEKETLNREILFTSRKQFGMFGNIQWHVTRIQDNQLTVRVSSERTDIDREQIAVNISASITSKLPDATVTIDWVPWKPEHGSGVLVSSKGKTQKRLSQELLAQLRK